MFDCVKGFNKNLVEKFDTAKKIRYDGINDMGGDGP